MVLFGELSKNIELTESPIFKALEKESDIGYDISSLDSPITFELREGEAINFEKALIGDFDEEYLRSGFEHITVDDVNDKINDCFRNIDDTLWVDLTTDEKSEIIMGWASFVSEKIGLKEQPSIVIYRSEVEGECGSYKKSDNIVRLNEYMMDDVENTFNTVAHELWHAHQYECAEEPQTYRDVMYRYNFNNYISPEINYDMYRNQLVESEARAFATHLLSGSQELFGRL